MISIRPAVSNDVEALCSFDLIAREANDRREFIRHAVNAGTCYAAVAEQGVIGYGVLNYTFYRQGCIDMLYVAAGQRRQGAGTALLEHMERQCQTPKLWYSRGTW